jgi:transposase
LPSAGSRPRARRSWLKELVDEVVLANPARLKVIFDTVYKDDRIDATKLAELAMVGLIPRSYICSDEAWERRQDLRHRVSLVRSRSRVRNRIHFLIDQYPDAEPARPDLADLFCRQGRAWLESVKLPPQARRRLTRSLEHEAYLGGEVRKSDKLVREIAREDRRCAHLLTIPGIGFFFAVLILAEVDDIARFQGPRHFASYAALVPGRDRSSDREVLRPVHRQGNRYLKWAFVEAAMPAVKSDLGLRLFYERLAARKGPKGRLKAKVAVARKLAEITYRVLVEERPFKSRV